jgi:tyrosine-protein kinase Etk/Wzc
MNDLSNLQPSMEEVHLYDYLRVVMRRKKTVIGVFLAVFLVVAAYTFTRQPLYESSATLYVQNAKKQGDLLADLTAGNGTPIEAEIEILRSRTNTEEVVRRLHLNWLFGDVPKTVTFTPLEFSSDLEDPVFDVEMTGPDSYLLRNEEGETLARGRSGERVTGKGVTLLLQNLQGRKGDSFRATLGSPLQTAEGLRKAVDASEIGEYTNLIKLSYQGPRPELTRDVVNTLAQVYLERSVSVKSEEARRTVEFIQQQLDEMRAQLNGAEENLQKYKQQSGLVRLDAEGQSLVQDQADLEKQRSALALGQRQLELAVDGLQGAMSHNEPYAPTVHLDDPVVAALAKNLADLQVKRQGLLVEYTESHPRSATSTARSGRSSENSSPPTSPP